MIVLFQMHVCFLFVIMYLEIPIDSIKKILMYLDMHIPT